MNLRTCKAALAAFVTAALAACSGGSNSTVVPHTVTPTSAPVALPTAEFAILLPAKAPQSGSVRLALQSVNGTPNTSVDVVVPLSSSAPGCSATGQGLSCTVPVAGVTGTDVFTISTYGSSNGTGAVLATASIAVTVSPGAQKAVPISLGGVPASLSFSPSHLALVDDGTIHRVPITIDAMDASGAQIVGAAPYQSPVSLQIENDGSHALSLSTTSVSEPGTVVTLTYDGSKPLADAQIVASGGGLRTASLDAAPFSASPGSLTVLDDSTAGASLQLSESGFTGTFSAALGNPNDAAVTVIPGTLGSGTAVVTVVPKPGVRFDVTDLTVGDGLAGETVPVSIVPQNSSYQSFGVPHEMSAPVELTRGPDGRLWSGDAPKGNLVAFDPATQAYTTYHVVTNANGPASLAFDDSGNLWFTDRSRIGEFIPSSGAVTFFSSGLTFSSNITKIVAGPTGTHSMWFYDMGMNSPIRSGKPSYFGSIDTTNGSIVEHQTANNVTPVVSPMSMAVGPDNAIWFADGANGAIGKIDPASGAISEYSVDTPQYPSQSPGAIAFGPDGKLWFLSASPSTGAAIYGTVDPSSGAVSVYNNGIVGGLFYDMIGASDHNLWFAEEEGFGFFLSGQTTIGVINPATHAIYQYPSFIPQFDIITSLVDDGNGAFWMLDGGGYGQIGKVTFK